MDKWQAEMMISRGWIPPEAERPAPSGDGSAAPTPTPAAEPARAPSAPVPARVPEPACGSDPAPRTVHLACVSWIVLAGRDFLRSWYAVPALSSAPESNSTTGTLAVRFRFSVANQVQRDRCIGLAEVGRNCLCFGQFDETGNDQAARCGALCWLDRSLAGFP